LKLNGWAANGVGLGVGGWVGEGVARSANGAHWGVAKQAPVSDKAPRQHQTTQKPATQAV